MWNSGRLILFLIIAASLCFCVRTRHQGEELTDQCVCSVNKTDYCTCCKIITLSLDHDEELRKEYNDTICVKIKNLRSKSGIRFYFSWNGRILIQHKLRTLNFPPFCVATPRIHSTDVCLKFNNLTITRTRTTGCVDFEVDSITTTNVFKCGCFALVRRHKIPKKKKKSSLLNLLKSKNIKRVRLVNKNKSIWKDFLLKNLGKNSSSVIARWLGRERARNASGEGSSVVGDTTSLSVVDCWCHESLFVRCECCVPIFGKQETRYRGCVKLKHLPYNKDLSVTFTLNGDVKMKESIPSSISQKLCSHYKMDQELKIGVCIKPSRRITKHQRRGLCLDIDARKSNIRFKHRFGCVFLTTRNTPQEVRLYTTGVGE